MTVEHRTGDLFAQSDLRGLINGCNTQGVMGAGIAPIFKKHWPDMFTEYRHRCLNGDFNLGDLHAWETPKGNWIYNLASQQRPGKDARLDAIETSLTAVLTHASAHNVPIVGTPRIGAGLGGLAWKDVHQLLHHVADNHPVLLVVVSQPGAPA